MQLDELRWVAIGGDSHCGGFPVTRHVIVPGRRISIFEHTDAHYTFYTPDRSYEHVDTLTAQCLLHDLISKQDYPKR
jgi:hypothetical protein